MDESEKIERFQEDLIDWSEGNLREFPWRGEDVTPFQVLIAEILLSATLAKKVADIYPRFTDEYPDPMTLAEADVEEMAHLLEPLGLHNRRAQALVKLGGILREGEIPQEASELRKLPWLDYYGANALLCFGFGERRPIVDTNVTRVFNRAFGTDFEGSEDMIAWTFAEEVLPEQDYGRFNLALLDFGAAVCTASNPKCEMCPISYFCDYYQVGQA